MDDAGVKLDVSRKNALQFLAKGLRSNQIRDLKLKASKFYKGFRTSGTWKNYTIYISYYILLFETTTSESVVVFGTFEVVV